MTSNKKFVVEANFIQTACSLNVSLEEFLLLLYFENRDDLTINFDDISKRLKISKECILNAFNNLLSKKIIKVVSEKNSEGKLTDKIILDNFYDKAKELRKKEEQGKEKQDIFSIFQEEFKRPLTSFEIEIIKAWVEKLYSEELIITALKEAVYNGAMSIRYIDAILHDWSKKGLTCKEDIDNYLINKDKNKKQEDLNLFEYNWLDDDDK